MKAKTVSGAKNTHDVAGHIKNLNDELTEIGTEVDNLIAVHKAAIRAKTSTDPDDDPDYSEDGAAGGARGRLKSFGQLFVESDAYKLKAGQSGPEVHIDMDLKTLMTTTAGWAPEVTRTDRLVEEAVRPIQVADLIPQTTTGQAAVQYMEETTFTNAAQETLEAGTYQEAALAYTEQTSLVRKIAVFLPVTDEQLEDEPRVRGVIDNRLPFMIRQRLDLQILVGNGTAPNLRGINNVVGIQTQAKGADPLPDAVYKGDREGRGHRAGTRQRGRHAPERLAGDPASPHRRRHLHLGQPVGCRSGADLGSPRGTGAGADGEHRPRRRLRELLRARGPPRRRHADLELALDVLHRGQAGDPRRYAGRARGLPSRALSAPSPVSDSSRARWRLTLRDVTGRRPGTHRAREPRWQSSPAGM